MAALRKFCHALARFSLLFYVDVSSTRSRPSGALEVEKDEVLRKSDCKRQLGEEFVREEF